MEIFLNVYDVTSTPGDPKSTVVRLNNFTRAAAVGGVFHGGIQISSVEFSYGFCERGTGVYAVEAKQNPMYQYRETISLGSTTKSMDEIKEIIHEVKALWPGYSYDLLNRNCCHFCEDLAARLGVQPVPGWLNRFASAAATTIAVTQETVRTVQDIGQEISRLSGESLSFMRSTWQRTLAAASQQQQQLTQRLQQQRSPVRSRINGAAGSPVREAASPPAPAAGANGTAGGSVVYDYPSDYYQQQQQQRSSTSAPVSSSTNAGNGDSASSGNAGGLTSSASTARHNLLAGMQHAGQQLRATTSKLGQRLQQQIMKGNAAEQQSWQQALEPSAAADEKAGRNAVPDSGLQGRTASLSTSAVDSSEQQQQGPLHQGLLPGAQPKLAQQFCINSSTLGHEDDPFAALLDEGDEGQDGVQQQFHDCLAESDVEDSGMVGTEQQKPQQHGAVAVLL